MNHATPGNTAPNYEHGHGNRQAHRDADKALASNLLTGLQTTLQHRYDITLPYSVEQFVSHDADIMCALTGQKPTTPEMLLVHEDGDCVDITLFLDQSLLDEIDQQHWPQHWHGERFDDYCVVLEGISHFVYLSWSAHHDRSIKLLELELQAEVDKFVIASLDTRTTDNHSLMVRLFENVSYRGGLSPELHDRYEKANHLARHYCQWLCDNFDLSTDNRKLTAELARFYRINGSAKIRHITDRLH